MTVLEEIDAVLGEVEEYWVGQALESVRDLLDGAVAGPCGCEWDDEDDGDGCHGYTAASWVAAERRGEASRVAAETPWSRYVETWRLDSGLEWGSGWIEVGVTTDGPFVLDERGVRVISSARVVSFNMGGSVEELLIGRGEGYPLGLLGAAAFGGERLTGLLNLPGIQIAPAAEPELAVPEPLTVEERISRRLAAGPVPPEVGPRVDWAAVVPPARSLPASWTVRF